MARIGSRISPTVFHRLRRNHSLRPIAICDTPNACASLRTSSPTQRAPPPPASAASAPRPRTGSRPAPPADRRALAARAVGRGPPRPPPRPAPPLPGSARSPSSAATRRAVQHPVPQLMPDREPPPHRRARRLAGVDPDLAPAREQQPADVGSLRSAAAPRGRRARSPAARIGCPRASRPAPADSRRPTATSGSAPAPARPLARRAARAVGRPRSRVAAAAEQAVDLVPLLGLPTGEPYSIDSAST